VTMNWGPALAVASGVALAALGAWALTLKPRRTTTLAFAAYACGTGGFIALYFVSFAWPDAQWLPAGGGASTFSQLITVGVWAAVITLVLGVPRPLLRDEWRLLVVPGLVTAGFVALAFGIEARTFGLSVQFAVNVGNWAATFFAIGVALARFRAAGRPDGGVERRNLALLAAALALIVGEATGRGTIEVLARGTPYYGPGLSLAANVVLLSLAVAWLVATANAPPGSARHARDVALFALGAWLVGGAWSAWAGLGPAMLGSFGIATAVGGVLLARSAFSGDLLGADVQLRWTLSKSTVAAVFIAVFFVASEAAQQFLGETLGSTYVGIAAAGALVFVLSPLQRAAERLAEKAVPLHEPAPVARGEKASPGPSEDAFARAVRLALRGGITRREEHDLAVLADSLGLSAKRALDIRERLEEEEAR